MKNFEEIKFEISQGDNLTSEESEKVFDKILSQKIEENEIIKFLIGLSKKGESASEILGAIKSIKKNAKIIEGFEDSFDTCGTGGDGAKTFNISTLTAIIISCCGVRVAKHGNKAVSSLTGSADVLSELGINININDSKVKKCLDKLNLCFLFAPNFHPILKNVADIRKKIGKRTIFNLLGPLLNPVQCKRQIIGVYNREKAEQIAETLKKMDIKKVWVVTCDNEDKTFYDELTTLGFNYIEEISKNLIKTSHKKIKIKVAWSNQVKNGYNQSFIYQGRSDILPDARGDALANVAIWHPDEKGTYSFPDRIYREGKDKASNYTKYLIGGNAKKNAGIIMKILTNKDSGKEYLIKKDNVLFNCAAALMVAGITEDLRDGFEIANESIKSGSALKKLNDLIELTNK